ncbi:hypothetical protein ACNQ2T_01865 [Mycoplasma sp. Z407A]|uniref:hypothetical protein n=1 Tax=Mycoplasma sp. Z407A TaxID=3401678 RepID=UPI003AADF8FE
MKIDIIYSEFFNKNWNPKYIIQGSFSLYLHNIIERMPRDIDILLDFDDEATLFDRNAYWNEIKKQFTIIDKNVENEFFNSLTLNDNKENVELECMIFKKIPEKMIVKIDSGQKTISPLYMIGFKFCQLCTNAIKTKNNYLMSKIQNCISDIDILLNRYDYLSVSEIINIFKECILINLPYELLAYTNSPYNFICTLDIINLFDTFNISFENNRRAFYILTRISESSQYTDFIASLNNIYNKKMELILMIELFAYKNNLNYKDVDNFGQYFRIKDNYMTMGCAIYLYNTFINNKFSTTLNSFIDDNTYTINNYLYINILNILVSFFGNGLNFSYTPC